MIRSAERKIGISITLVILSIITIVIFSYLQTKKTKEVSFRIHYTQNILKQLGDVYSSVVDHARATRNFALNGDSKIITTMNSTAANALAKFELLHNTVKDKPVLKIQADSLAKYIFKRIDFSNHIINVAKEKGFDAAAAIYETGTGRDYNNMVLYFIQKMLNSELNLLEQDEQKNAGGIRQLGYYLLALLAFILALIFIIVQKIRYDNTTQKKVAEKLKQFNTSLENQVKIKTADIQKSEKQLEASEKNLRQVLSSANENFYVIDKNYIVTIINEVAQKNLSKAWNVSVVPGTNISGHLPDEKNEPVRKSFARAFSGEKIEYELQLFIKDLPAWVVVSYSPIIDDSGNINGVGVFTKDISERKKTEEEKEKIRYTLNERVKELITLYRTGQLLQEENKNDSDVLQELVTIIPGGWQYPEITGARIKLGDEIFTSSNFGKGVASQHSSFQNLAGLSGIIEITYLENRPSEAEGPFLAEERNLLNMLAEMLQIYFDRKWAHEKLKQSYEETRLLASHIENIREEEKIKIAREIHDELGQQITGLKMDVSWMAKRLNGENEILYQKTKEILGLLDETVKSVRRIASELRPGMLDDLGLIAAIDWQGKEFEKRSGIKIIFEHPIIEFMTPTNISTGLYRIFQESLTNVARHAAASEILVSIDKTNTEVILKINDNGKGFDVSKLSSKHTLGLLGMKERTMMMGGRCDIFSEPGKGTTVSVYVPLVETKIEVG